MQSLVRLPSVTSSNSTPTILTSRSQYCPCHIAVPDTEQRLSAILVDSQYYSFFRVEKDEKRAIEIATRLTQRDETAIITKTPKGYAVWVLELDASPTASKKSAPPSETVAKPTSSNSYKILASRNEYQSCHIRVPDLDKPLAAILFEGSFYSLFKVVEDVEQAVELIRRLSYRGEETVITKMAKGYGIWILETDARLD